MSRTFAPIVRRRTPTFPSRMGSYFDCTAWGGGHIRIHPRGMPPGAASLNDRGDMLNLQTGEVYHDSRFIKENATCAS